MVVRERPSWATRTLGRLAPRTEVRAAGAHHDAAHSLAAVAAGSPHPSVHAQRALEVARLPHLVTLTERICPTVSGRQHLGPLFRHEPSEDQIHYTPQQCPDGQEDTHNGKISTNRIEREPSAEK